MGSMEPLPNAEGPSSEAVSSTGSTNPIESRMRSAEHALRDLPETALSLGRRLESELRFRARAEVLLRLPRLTQQIVANPKTQVSLGSVLEGPRIRSKEPQVLLGRTAKITAAHFVVKGLLKQHVRVLCR